MQDQLRDQIINYLSQNRVGVLSTAGALGTWTMPVRYQPHGLEAICLIPRWADVLYHLEQNPQVVLVIVADNPGNHLCWLHYRGLVQPVTAPGWTGLLPENVSLALANELYQLIRLTPQRIDLIDERRGWGRRDTLE